MSNISNSIDEYITAVFGPKELKHYYDYIGRKPIDYIRISKNINYDIVSKLKNYNISIEKSYENIYKVVDDPENLIGKTLEFVIGDYYIQSLSSTLPPIVLNPKENENVIDLCAAPGSKTTQLSQMMNYTGFLVANEPDIKRVKTLAHNIDKYSSFNTSIMINKGELLSKYFNDEFDKVLADVPCTGLGILNKKNEIKNWWSKKIVDAILDIQYKILLSGIRLVKVGGTVVYSTCTLTVEENEFIINKILKNYPVEVEEFNLNIKYRDPILSYNGNNFDNSISKAKRVFPWEVDSEGFFICKLRKIDKIENKEKFNFKNEIKDYFNIQSAKYSDYIKILANNYGIELSEFENKLFLLKGNDIYMTTNETPFKYLSIFNRSGIKIATINKNNQVVPHTYFSLIFTNKITNNILDVSAEQLKNYLAGSNFSTDSPDGYKVIRYNGSIIGNVLVKTGIAKSQFPKSKRSQQIVIR
ncbi:MAG TPA: RsmB/NOP family class I SAM-dependent RNA methyltransferase [Ignavibacteriales bacterium]|nr:RsmB/NOP family class I SAM-dependent RNA methyltransferase [Ignavibacteriales bacterium]HOL80651.1 RsmB/NOP family class I SAM-dependent RNA methyltransferase [Ignavibacteriales bacterium]HOM64339.1 RsmB/NOP family class I SAM-dependent RNA methyltransferase [Ignavibacteriales bacterium]HPD67127.1 RsmB/NOP family class I SAM-dependent RNA methyltransferase [Ignavibacteriales bacterium]HPP33016.1 RsmB/NOP family class I SAM-dependent RNA methyltransferase [Ignavibacteriales bacterium]